MNWDQVEGNWEQAKGKVREMWGRLTDDDINVMKGKRQQLAGKLQERYGYAKDRAEAEINKFLTSCDSGNEVENRDDDVSDTNTNDRSRHS